MGLKKRIALITSCIMVFVNIISNCVLIHAKEGTSSEGIELLSESAVLMEPITGQILYEKDPHTKLAPASVTKVMTLLLIYEAEDSGKISWDEYVTVSANAAGMGGSQVYLEASEKQTAKDLTKCIAIASANDAAVAMAEHVAGSEHAFVDLMNAKAKELGMNDTYFVNASGLDANGHVSSAHDIAIMSRELISKYPEVLEYSGTWQDSIIHSTRRGDEEFGLTNTNKFIKLYNGATGLKTGSTDKALYCISATAERNGMVLIGVLLANPNYKSNFEEATKLLDYGFSKYAMIKGLPEGEYVGKVTVYKGTEDMVEAVVKKETGLLIVKGEAENLEKEISLVPFIRAPLESGSKIGEVIYKIEGTEVGREDIIAKDTVTKANIFTMLKKIISNWC